jgi:hypothetical protein
MTGNDLKDILQSAVQLNKDHQYALNVYTERLETELEAVDKLLVRFLHLNEVIIIQPFQTAAELEEEELHLDIAGSIQVAGARKPLGLLSSTDLLSEVTDMPAWTDLFRLKNG